MKLFAIVLVFLFSTQQVLCIDYAEVRRIVPLQSCFRSMYGFVKCFKLYAEAFTEDQLIEYAGIPMMDNVKNFLEFANSAARGVVSFTGFCLDNYDELEKELFRDLETYIENEIMV